MADETTTTTTSEAPEAGRCKRGKRGRRTGFIALAILAVAAAIAFALPAALAARGGGPWGHGHGEALTAEQVAEKLDKVAERLAGRVDADEAQQAAIRAALQPAATEMLALKKDGRAVAQRFEAALAGDQLDPAELQRLQKEMTALADRATQELVDTVVALDGALTPAQRQELVEDFRRMRKWHHR